jgi:hypothetical protein
MNTSEVFIRRPIATSLLMAAIALFGIIAYRLPKEKILLQGDVYGTPNPNAPAPPPNAPPNLNTVAFVDNMQRLGLNPDQNGSVHAPNPDRQIPRQEVLASIGR